MSCIILTIGRICYFLEKTRRGVSETSKYETGSMTPKAYKIDCLILEDNIFNIIYLLITIITSSSAPGPIEEYV